MHFTHPSSLTPSLSRVAKAHSFWKVFVVTIVGNEIFLGQSVSTLFTLLSSLSALSDLTPFSSPVQRSCGMTEWHIQRRWVYYGGTEERSEDDTMEVPIKKVATSSQGEESGEDWWSGSPSGITVQESTRKSDIWPAAAQTNRHTALYKSLTVAKKTTAGRTGTTWSGSKVSFFWEIIAAKETQTPKFDKKGVRKRILWSHAVIFSNTVGQSLSEKVVWLVEIGADQCLQGSQNISYRDRGHRLKVLVPHTCPWHPKNLSFEWGAESCD